MNKRILALSPDELSQFISERRSLRPTTFANRKAKRKEKKTDIATDLAAELGIPLDQLIAKVEDLL